MAEHNPRQQRAPTPNRTAIASTFLQRIQAHTPNSAQPPLFVTASILLILTSITVNVASLGFILFMPLILISSPIWFPVATAILVVFAGLFSTCGFGVLSVAGSCWLYRYIRGMHPPGSDRFDYARSRTNDYKCTVEYYFSHFLVHESKARIGQKWKPTLRIDAVDRGSSRWRGADILVFNTAHWWSHYKTKVGINYYQEGNQVHPKLDVSIAFKRALMTQAAWVDRHINRGQTQVFFQNSSPSHFRGGLWNSGGHCREATWPLNDTSGMEYPEKNKIVEEVILQMKTPVTLMNVTGLSAHRIDGHPSIYGKKSGRRKEEEKKKKEKEKEKERERKKGGRR